MTNFGPLTAEIGWQVWGIPANFNGFRVLALLLQQRSLEANQTLHDVWPSPGLVHYVYIFGGSCPLTEFCQVETSLCVQILRSPISLLTALLHGTVIVGVSQTLRRWIEDSTPPIFGRATITLVIGPHSSFMFDLVKWATNHIRFMRVMYCIVSYSIVRIKFCVTVRRMAALSEATVIFMISVNDAVCRMDS